MLLRNLVTALAMLAVMASTAPFRAQEANAAPLPEEQARLQERMQEVERRLLELAGVAEETWRREVLRSALRSSRGGLIVSRMREIALLLEGGRYGEAASLEQEVVAELRRLAELLSAGETEAALAGLRDAQRMLAELARRQSELRRQTEGLGEGHPSREDYLRAAEQQAALEKALRSLLPELEAGPAGRKAGAALRHMVSATQALREMGAASAFADQQEAAKALAAARDALRREIGRLEAARRARARRGVREILQDVARELEDIQSETEALPPVPEEGERLPRSVRLRLMALAERQRGLLGPADEALSLLDGFGATAAWPAAIGHLKQGITEGADLLARGEGASAAAAQTELLQTLQELIAALQPGEPEAERTGETPPQRRMAAGRAGAGAAPRVRMAEELKVLRAMQAELNRRTARATARRARGDDTADPSRLAERQAAVRGALEELRGLSEGGDRQ